MTPQGEGEVTAAVHAHHNVCDRHQSWGSLPQADPQPLPYLEQWNGAKLCGQETGCMGTPFPVQGMYVWGAGWILIL